MPNQNKERGPPKGRARRGPWCRRPPVGPSPIAGRFDFVVDGAAAGPRRAGGCGLTAAARHGARTCVASRLPPPAAATPTRRGSVGLSRPRGAAPPLVRVVSLARRCPSGGAGSRVEREKRDCQYQHITCYVLYIEDLSIEFLQITTQFTIQSPSRFE